jgi:hypothetical protein
VPAPVDQRRQVPRAEAVVDVDRADAGGAGVEHREEGSDAAERGAVADGRGNRDDGAADEGGDDAGKGALHARDDDDDVRRREAVGLAEDAVDAGDADVVERASSATGMSPVPAVTMRISPGGGSQDSHFTVMQRAFSCQVARRSRDRTALKAALSARVARRFPPCARSAFAIALIWAVVFPWQKTTSGKPHRSARWVSTRANPKSL